MSTLKPFYLKPLAAALLLTACSAYADSPFDQIVAFGDSLTDSGQFPDAGGPINTTYMVPGSGLRFTNRVDGAGSQTDTVAIQRLSQRLGLGYLAASTPYLPSPVTGFPAGTNYAVGGYTSAQIKASITDADGSVVYNPAAGPAKVRDGYLAELGSARAKTLYFVNGGGNDVLGIINPFDANNPTLIATAANTLMAGINALDAAGAEYIMVSNLPDVGTTPAGIGSGAQPFWSPLSALYNSTLYEGLRNSSANVISVDARGLVAEVAASPAEFGFVTDAAQLAGTCYDGTGGSCFEHPVYGITQATADPSKLLFNDGVHPTAAAQQIVADYMFSLIQAPQQVGQLPVLGASLVNGGQMQLTQHMQANLASGKLKAGNWQIFAGGNANEFEVRSNYADSVSDADGATLGLQYGVNENWSVGVGFSSADGDLSFADSASSYDATSQALTLFTGYTDGGHWLNASVSYGKQDYKDLNRVIPLGLSSRTETGSTEGTSTRVSAEYGYNISPHTSWDYGPKVEFSHSVVSVDGYDEASGLTTSLSFDDQEHTSTTADVGLFVHWRAMDDNLVLTSEWGVRSELKDQDYRVTMSSQTLDLNSYQLPGYSQDKGQSWHGSVTASYYITPSAAISANWQTESGDDRGDHLGVGISYRF